jgi:hypothetical protein
MTSEEPHDLLCPLCNGARERFGDYRLVCRPWLSALGRLLAHLPSRSLPLRRSAQRCRLHRRACFQSGQHTALPMGFRAGVSAGVGFNFVRLYV